jgi:hypothetical protein
MKRLPWMLLVAGLLPALLGGCLASRHGHVALVAPPPLVAAAVTAAIASQIWVDGHWDWVGGRWVWSDGYWTAARPGHVWEQGVWLHVDGRYSWRPGRWRPAGGRVHVRDHRRR